MQNKEIQPIYIVGATASGKSELAFLLAQELGGVIISADSMQIYRGLDVGTAKESVERRALIKHEMIDIIDANEDFSVAEYADMAKRAIENAQNSGKYPIVVGGTGLYFEALFYPMSFADTRKDPEIRAKLEAEYAEFGKEYMHNMLAELDANAAARLHPNDQKRVIRALEVAYIGKKTLSESADERQTPNVIAIGLNTDRAVLYDRINRRVDKMFQNGLIDEVYSVGDFLYQSMQAIGYKEFSQIARTTQKAELTDSQIEEIKEKIKKNTRNYAKRQLTWFRRYPFIQWFECGDYQNAIEYVKEKLIK